MSDNNSLTKDLVKALLTDRRHDRLWRNIRFFIFIFVIILYAILIFSPSRSSISNNGDKPYVSLIRLNGEILADHSFSAQRVIPLLNKAFRDKKAKGVVLVINSPGGSAVQASIIHDKILQLKKKYQKKVVVIGEDALASGAYMVATAADKIYVHNDTLTGSIGVIMSGFGFNGVMEKIGVSRRVFTAGDHKDRLDPFLPLNPADVSKVHRVLNQAHQNFIEDVEKSRGNKLKGNKTELFSGDFWIGQRAVQLGLADGTGNLWTILKKEFKAEHYRNYSEKPNLFQVIFKDLNTELNLGLTANNAIVKEQMN
jgi:protease IV